MSPSPAPRLETVPVAQAPLPLLLEADPAPEKVRRYLATGHCRVARHAGESLGVYVLQRLAGDTWELMNIAVAPKNALRYAGHAEIELRETREWAEVRVIDHGSGIDGARHEAVRGIRPDTKSTYPGHGAARTWHRRRSPPLPT